MDPMDSVFIRSELSFQDLAEQLRSTWRLAPDNVQDRDGLNIGGGQYFEFQVLGMEIHLIRNQGEVEVDNMTDWPYYLWAEPAVTWDRHGGDSALYAADYERWTTAMITHLERTLRAAGLTVQTGRFM